VIGMTTLRLGFSLQAAISEQATEEQHETSEWDVQA
jgi:hypothetical protein